MSHSTAGSPLATPKISEDQGVAGSHGLMPGGLLGRMKSVDFLVAPRLQAQVQQLTHDLRAALLRADLAVKSAGRDYELAMQLRAREEQLGLLCSILEEVLPHLDEAASTSDSAGRLSGVAKACLTEISAIAPVVLEGAALADANVQLRLFMAQGGRQPN